MTITFNHTIVYATDKRHSAEFLANVLGLPKPQAMWSFMAVPLDHGVALDFATADRPISPQHTRRIFSLRPRASTSSRNADKAWSSGGPM